MFRDQKNINIRVLSWLLLAVFTNNMHYLCVFIYLDVLHINYLVDLSFIKKDLTFLIKDVFPFYDAPNNVKLDIEYYLYFLGGKITTAILAYLLYSAIIALNTLMETTHIKRLNFYRRIKILSKYYLFIQVFGVINYLLFAGQFMHGIPVIFYTICILIIFFIRKTNQGWEFKAEM